MVSNKSTYHALIIGAGEAGLMCAIEAGKPKRREFVIDKASKAGPKILKFGVGSQLLLILAITVIRPRFCVAFPVRLSERPFRMRLQRFPQNPTIN